MYFDENNTPLLKAESGPFSLALSNIAELEGFDAVANIENVAFVYAKDKNIVVKGAKSKITVYDLQGRFVTQRTVCQDIETIPLEKKGCYIVFVDETQGYEIIVW